MSACGVPSPSGLLLLDKALNADATYRDDVAAADVLLHLDAEVLAELFAGQPEGLDGVARALEGLDEDPLVKDVRCVDLRDVSA